MKALKCIAIIQSDGNMDDIAIGMKQVYDLPIFQNSTIQQFQNE